MRKSNLFQNLQIFFLRFILYTESQRTASSMHLFKSRAHPPQPMVLLQMKWECGGNGTQFSKMCLKWKQTKNNSVTNLNSMFQEMNTLTPEISLLQIQHQPKTHPTRYNRWWTTSLDEVYGALRLILRYSRHWSELLFRQLRSCLNSVGVCGKVMLNFAHSVVVC